MTTRKARAKATAKTRATAKQLPMQGSLHYGLRPSVEMTGLGGGRVGVGFRGRSVIKALPEVCWRMIWWEPRRGSTSSRFSSGTKRSLRGPWPHWARRSAEVREIGGAAGEVLTKIMEVVRPSTKFTRRLR